MEAHLVLLTQIQIIKIILVQTNFLDQDQAVNQNLATKDPRNKVEKTEQMELGIIHPLHHLLTKMVQKDQSLRRDKSIQEQDNLSIGTIPLT